MAQILDLWRCRCAAGPGRLETAAMGRSQAIDKPDRVEFALADEAATGRLAERIARQAEPGDLIALSGPLGVGKTAFVRAFIGAMARRSGVAAPAEVPSPTF